MAELILESGVGFLLLTQLLMLWHCYQFRINSGLFAQSLNTRVDEFSKGFEGGIEVLEYIAETLEENGSGGNPLQGPLQGAGESIMQTLTNQLMAKVMMGPHGESKEDRPLYQEEQPAPEKQIRESTEHS